MVLPCGKATCDDADKLQSTQELKIRQSRARVGDQRAHCRLGASLPSQQGHTNSPTTPRPPTSASRPLAMRSAACSSRHAPARCWPQTSTTICCPVLSGSLRTSSSNFICTTASAAADQRLLVVFSANRGETCSIQPERQ
eukprot:1522831-Prymnesium_polylepis.1